MKPKMQTSLKNLFFLFFIQVFDIDFYPGRELL